MKITVTKQDISRGIPKNFRRCPIARAIRRATGIKDVKALPGYASVLGRYTHLPLVATDFIYRFDAGVDVEPFTFSLPIPKNPKPKGTH